MPSTHAFSEKVALIMPGTNPIGRAVAMQLALCGAYVVVAHRFDDPAVSDIDELKTLGTLAASAAYSKPGLEGALEIAERVDGLYGRLDLLVNCPVISDSKAFHETSPERFSYIVENLFESTFFLTRECIRLMSDRPKPRMVNVFSACDGQEATGDVAASALNAALAEFTAGLSRDLPAKYQINGIRVSDRSRLYNAGEILDPQLFRPKKGVDPDDVARSVLFLLSSEANGLRGEILNIGR